MTTERELMEKIEKLRAFLLDKIGYLEEFSITEHGNGCLSGYKSTLCEFSSLFPPPKKGCWGFWRDRNDYVRYFEGHPTKESAESGRAHLEVAGCNPSPVFFLEEE